MFDETDVLLVEGFRSLPGGRGTLYPGVATSTALKTVAENARDCGEALEVFAAVCGAESAGDLARAMLARGRGTRLTKAEFADRLDGYLRSIKYQRIGGRFFFQREPCRTGHRWRVRDVHDLAWSEAPQFAVVPELFRFLEGFPEMTGPGLSFFEILERLRRREPKNGPLLKVLDGPDRSQAAMRFRGWYLDCPHAGKRLTMARGYHCWRLEPIERHWRTDQ